MDKNKHKILNDLKHDNYATVKLLYNTLRESFLLFAVNKFSIVKEDAEEIYQDAFLAMYNNVAEGKEITCSLKTYLYQIGIHKILDLLKSKGFIVHSNSRDFYFFDKDIVDNILRIEECEILQEKEKLVYELVNNMQSPCREILFGVYYDQFSMDTLANMLGYKDATVAKSSKYKCMQKMKNALSNSFKRLGISK